MPVRGDAVRLLSEWNANRSIGKICSCGLNTVVSGHHVTRSRKEHRQRRLHTATRMPLIRAIKDLDFAIANAPNSGLAYYNRAAAWETLGNYRKSQDDLDTAWKLGYR